MIKILKESIQDVENFLQTSELRGQVLDEIPEVRDDPSSVETEVNQFILNAIKKRFPDERSPKVVTVSVVKVVGSDIDVLSTGHQVVEFNNNYYDFTAHEFSDTFRGLSILNTPVVQSVITNDRQISEGVSTVKSYALLGD